MRGPSVGLAIAILAGTLAACGSIGVPIDDFVAEYIAAECAMWTRCHVASDQAFCVAAMRAFRNPDKLAREVAAVKAGKAVYDGNRARGCVDSFAKISCDELWSNSTGGIGSACQGTFSGGATADGDSCLDNVECLPGSYCAFTTSDSCTGVCTSGWTGCQEDSQCAKGKVCDAFWPNDGECVDPAPPGATVGSSCGTYQSCQPGLYCSLWNGCQPQGKEGDYCDWVTGCAAGLTCTPTNDPSTVVAVCRRIAAKGEPCEAVNQCGGILWSTIKCDMTSHVCVDNTSEGPCLTGDTDFRAANGCDPFTSYCDDSTSTLTCKPYTAAIGDPCTVNRAECGVSAWCQQDLTDSTGTKGFCAAYPVCTP
jgi:hypothetical protein